MVSSSWRYFDWKAREYKKPTEESLMGNGGFLFPYFDEN